MQNFRAQRPDETNPTFDARPRGPAAAAHDRTGTSSFQQIELPAQDYSFKEPSLQTPTKKKKYGDIFDEDALQSMAKMEFEDESDADRDGDQSELAVAAAYHTTDVAGSQQQRALEQDEVGVDSQHDADNKAPFSYLVPSLDLKRLNENMPNDFDNDDRLQRTEKPPKKI